MLPLYNFEIEKFRVVDGDTVELLLKLGFNTFSEQVCRINGIDAPEKNTEAGKQVKAVLSTILESTAELFCTSIKWDKFGGRFDGDILLGEQSLSEWMLNQGLAKAYAGKKKQPWTEEELSAIVQKCAEILAKPPF